MPAASIAKPRPSSSGVGAGKARSCLLPLLVGLIALARAALAQNTFVEFAAPIIQVREGSAAAAVQLIRWGNTNTAVSVECMATSGTAAAGLDFVGVTNSLIFAPGETNKTLAVPLLDDGLVEETESVLLRFGNFSSGGTTGNVNYSTLLLQDNEVPTVLDGGFVPNPAPAKDVFALVLQPDGKILAGGDFLGLGAKDSFVARPGVARFNSDGSVDPSFATSAGVAWGVYALALQADGKVLLGGGFSSSGTDARRFLARLNSDGSLDSSFAVNLDSEIRAVVVQPDQRILIAGRFTMVNGQSCGRVARLNPDGSLDASFLAGPGTGADNNVRTLVLQGDGRILIGGQFVRYGLTSRVRVARLDANGNLDATFDPKGGADDQVRAIAWQADGTIYIGGEFNSYNGVARAGLVRLLADGTQDLGFLASFRTRDNVRALLLEPDGKLLVGGSFTDPSSLARTNFARLLTNGYPDSTLLTSDGPNDEVFAIVRQGDGRVVIGGQFERMAGAPRPFLARLLSDSRIRTVDYAASTFLGAEAAGSTTITARRTGDSSGVVLATFFTSDGSALTPSDYLGVTNTLQFSPLQITRTFTVQLVNDGIPEGSENVPLGITNVSGAILGSLQPSELAIFDGSGYGVLTLHLPILNEDGPGAGVLVVRNGPTNFPVSVFYSTRDGTALAGVDYVPASGVFQLAPGQTSDYIELRPINDSVQEGDEYFFLDLRDTPEAPLLVTARPVLIDNEVGIGFFGVDSPLTVTEDIDSVTVFVSCAWDPAQPIEVDYATRDIGGAVAGLDYVPQFGTLIFATNHQYHRINVPILNDNVAEPLKAFAIQLVALRGPGVLTATNFVVTLADNDLGIECVTNRLNVGENAGVARVAVRRHDDGTNTVTVDYITADGSATAGVAGGDYTLTRGTLVLPPGLDEQFVSIPIREDLLLEADESFQLTLSHPTGGASLGRLSSTEVRIVDNDRPGSPDTRFQLRGVDDFVLQWFRLGTLALQPDGKVLLGGGVVARLLPDGQVDTNFQYAPFFPGHGVPAVLPDGRIIVGSTQSNSFGAPQCAFRLQTNGAFDPTFRTELELGRATTVVLSPDGGILLGGTFTRWQEPAPFNRAVVRLLPDGALDPNFNAGEFLPATQFHQTPSTVEAMLLEPDGRLVVGGQFTQAAGHACDHIVRLAPNGSVDSSFYLDGPGGGTNDGALVLALARQPFDGRLLVGGDFHHLQGVARPGLTRLNADGTVDLSFHPNVGRQLIVHAIVVQPDRKIIIGGGEVAWWDSGFAGFVLRLHPDGSLDETFAPGEVTGTVSDLALLPDGDVLACGAFSTFDGLYLPTVVRLNGGSPRYSILSIEPESLTLEEGNALAMLTVHRTGYTNWVTTVHYQTVPETAAQGDFLSTSGQLIFLPGEARKTIAVQVFDDWSIEGDETFRLALTNPSGDTTLLQSSVQVTMMDNERPGTSDALFTPGTDRNSQIEVIAVQPDGKIVIGGNFGFVSGVLCPGYARLHPDGSLDHGFAPESFRDGTVRTLALQADGGILLGGDFRVLQDTPRVGIGRLLPDGAVDTAFTSPLHDTGVLSQYITSLCLDPLGRILLAGAYAKGIEPVRPQLTRLLPNGGFDPTFDISPDFTSVQPFLAALAGDGRILVAGAIIENNVRLRPYVGRLLPNGALDPTFSPMTLSDGYISALLALPDGSALIAGGFTAINGLPAGRIARLLPDGTPAPFVAAGRGADETIFAMARQSDGRILVGGVFDHFDGVPRHRVARLHADLTLDLSFDPGAALSGQFSPFVTALAIEADGDVLAGGNFAVVSDGEHFNLARLRGVLAPCLSPVLAPAPGGLRLSLYVEPGRVCVLQTSTDLQTWLPWETNISVNGVIHVIVPPMADSPRRFYRGWQPAPPAN